MLQNLNFRYEHIKNCNLHFVNIDLFHKESLMNGIWNLVLNIASI